MGNGGLLFMWSLALLYAMRPMFVVHRVSFFVACGIMFYVGMSIMDKIDVARQYLRLERDHDGIEPTRERFWELFYQHESAVSNVTIVCAPIALLLFIFASMQTVYLVGLGILCGFGVPTVISTAQKSYHGVKKARQGRRVWKKWHERKLKRLGYTLTPKERALI